jgi:hypothetical protein
MDINTARKLGEEVGRVEDAHAHLLRQHREVGASDADVIDAAEQYCSAILARNAAFDAVTGDVTLGERRSGVVTHVDDDWLPGELEKILNNGQMDGPIQARVEKVLDSGSGGASA